MPAAFFEDDSKTLQEDDMGAGKAFRALLPLLREHTGRLLVCLGILAVATIASLAWPLLIQRAIDGPIAEALAKPAGERPLDGLVRIGLAVLAIQAVTALLQYVQRVRLEAIGQDIMLDLRKRIFGHILSLDISFFDRNPVGRLMARVESDTESLRLLFTNAVVLVVADLLLVAGIWGIMFWTSPKLAAVVVGVAPLQALVMYVFHRRTSHRFLGVRKRMADVTATLTEFLHGMSIVQIFHRGEYARDRVRQANRLKFRDQRFVEIAFCILFNALFFGEHLKIGLVLLFGALWGVSPGVIVLFMLLVWKEFEPIVRTADQLGSFQKGVAGARRIFALLSIEPKLSDPVAPREWPGLQRAIRFENVWFSYGDDENWVLRDVSFEVPAGSRTALAGVTGGGKSTIISLLLRLYDPQRGRITFDGVDIRDMRRADLRLRLALVLQDIFLFPGSVESNISLGAEDVSPEMVRRAAETVDAGRFIHRLPAGYGTEVSEKGANFSRGERQLLSFARALATDPEVLILDEATASVDPETERTIQDSLGRLMEGRTSLVIAHRLSTILDAGQILVIRSGEIVERGTHAELLARKGYYAKLFHLQFNSGSEGLRDAG